MNLQINTNYPQVVKNSMENQNTACSDRVIDEYAGVKYSKEDLVDGLLPVIVMAKNKKDVKTLEKELIKLDNDNKVVFDLNIIKGFSALVDPSTNWNNLPESVKICLDKKTVRVPEIPENNVSPASRLNVAIPTLNLDKVWEKGYTGKGVTIAVIDTGIFPHMDLVDRIVAFRDIVNNKNDVPYDDRGHGTHCSGDAAGSGKASNGLFKGAAPDAKLVGIKVLDDKGSGTDSQCIKGIEWAVENKDKYGIRVLSMSWGDSVTVSYKNDPVCLAIEEASKKGLISVISAGNSGPGPQTVGTPANSPSCIAVAALDDNKTPMKSDDEIVYFSSRGPSKIDNVAKPNIAVAGVDVVACNRYNGYTAASGTSMACPIMAGLLACLIQAKPSASPEELKEAVYSTADKMPKETINSQGAGVPDALKAIQKLGV